MMPHTVKQAGFTAVELLITLFIAAIFLFAGYQLYTQVLKEGSDADRAARISNIVYEKLRKEAGAISGDGVCAANTPTDEAQTVSGFSSVSLRTTITCPFTDTPKLSRVIVKATYSNGQATETLSHGLYVE